jgi:hypothetical protein
MSDFVATGKEVILTGRIIKLLDALYRTRKDRDKWKAQAEEMEKRWREAKARKDELRQMVRQLTLEVLENETNPNA